MSQAPTTSSPRKPSTDGILVLFHWISVAALLVNVLTGLRIAADAPDAVLARWLVPIALEGEIYQLHYLAGVTITAVALGYTLYLVRGRLAGRLLIPAAKARAMLDRGGRQAWRVHNVRIYYVLFGLIGLLAASGITLYLDIRPPFGVAWLLTLHLLAAYTLLGVTVLHVVAQYAFGAAGPQAGLARVRNGLLWLLKMLRPRFSRGMQATSVKLQSSPTAMVVAVATAVAAGGGLVVVDRSTLDTLPIDRIAAEQVPVLDGRGDDPAWAAGETARISTREGANLPGGESLVEVQAIATADTVYLKFRWEDPTRSLKHLPLIKRADGWRLLHEQYDVEDEDVYYEDKLGVLLGRSAEIGGGSTHLGPKPIDGLPGGLSGRGLHYTADGSITDMWHWKAVRSQPAGHTDDNSFGPPAKPKPEELAGTLRYKGGYVTDQGKASYKNNFGHQGPGGFRGPLKPARLPADLAALQSRLAPMTIDPAASDTVPWLMTEAETVPYSEELDALIPEGTVIPGVLLGGAAWVGDRADLRSGAEWADGHWMLEIARKLDTGSPTDIALVSGEPAYLWVSVFDHTQTRHSRHMRPIRLELSGPEA
jgi:Ethylbenzene dehydrogenase/Prokaryotic cytochrome b561